MYILLLKNKIKNKIVEDQCIILNYIDGINKNLTKISSIFIIINILF